MRECADTTIGFNESGELVGTIDPIAPDEFAELDDKLDGELREIVDRKIRDEAAALVWEAVTRFAIEIKSFKNPHLTLDAFCFAAGLYILEGKTESSIAREHGVTKQAVSKRIVAITESLGLPPSRGMKSEQARETYRKAHTKTK